MTPRPATPTVARASAARAEHDAAFRAALAHLRAGGCRDCAGGRLCPVGRQLDAAADRAAERWLDAEAVG